MPVIITDVSVVLSECASCPDDIEIRNQNRPIGIRISVDNLFLTSDKIEFVKHYDVSVTSPLSKT